MRTRPCDTRCGPRDKCQSTSCCLPRPLDTLALHARYALDEQGEDAEALVPAVSYGVYGAVPGDVPRGIRDARLRAIVELVHVSAQLEAQLYGAFASIQNDAPHLVHLAVVHGASLHFAKAVWVWSLEDVLAPAPSNTPDSPAAETQRKKVAVLLERKLVRHCMMHEAMQERSVPIGPTRILLHAPRTLRASGWTPRPHWHVPLDDAPPPEEEEAMDKVDDEADAVPAVHDTPVRVSRMHLPTSAIGRRHVRTSLVRPRTARRSAPTQLFVQGGLSAALASDHVWFECQSVLRGVP